MEPNSLIAAQSPAAPGLGGLDEIALVESRFDPPRPAQSELDYLVRALSHDLSANFMVLENSFQQLKNSASRNPLPELVEGMSHVEACLRESKRFLDDLGRLARTGNVSMEPSRVALSAAIQDVLYEFDSLLAERRIVVEVEPELPAVWCHETRLKQVISNLLCNAIRHGCDPRQPRITISQPKPTPCPPPEGYVWLCVHDNGRSIAPQYRDEIFLPGRRLAEARTAGTGMGLAIVKQIVEYYRGAVYVDPACSAGTAFVFSLPAA